jgi:hypothetical protein
MADSLPAADSTPTDTGGFGRLARRIAGWTANLLATALVLVAGLGVGRQVLVWWYESPPATAVNREQLPPETPAELRMWTSRGPLALERVVGDQAAAVAAMKKQCQSLAPGSELPKGVSQERDVGPGEQRFLEKLAKFAPVEQTKELDLYAPPGDVTMVVAVCRGQPRIAAWSFALEAEPATWSCYTFYSAK